MDFATRQDGPRREQVRARPVRDYSGLGAELVRCAMLAAVGGDPLPDAAVSEDRASRADVREPSR